MNYFNYYTEIEDAFVRRRGKHLFLSPMDWALMETWKSQGVPLHIVLRGVERAFDSFESRPRRRSVKSLLYCQEEVEAQYAEWLESRVGAHPTREDLSQSDKDEDSKTPFTPAAVRKHLQDSRTELLRLAESRTRNGVDELSESLARAASLIAALEVDFEESTTIDTRKLEDSLTGLERMLNQAVLTTFPTTDLETAKAEVKDQLKPYRKNMDPGVYNQTLDNLLMKKIRERLRVPRLSLFYL